MGNLINEQSHTKCRVYIILYPLIQELLFMADSLLICNSGKLREEYKKVA
jgi:hypothetical protein